MRESKLLAQFFLAGAKVILSGLDQCFKRRCAFHILFVRRYVENRLFLNGRYTIADIAVFAYATCVEDVGVQVDLFPHLRSWSACVGAQPGFLAPPR